MHTGEECDRQPSNARSMFYMFGRAKSGKIYWWAYNAGGASGTGQTFWKEVEAFKGMKVVRIVGAMPYRKWVTNSIPDKTGFIGILVLSSYIHLFCITGDIDKQALQLARLNLDNFGKWDATVPLSPPLPLTSTLEVAPVQTQSEFTQPGLIFHTFNAIQFYFRTLNTDGTAWDPSPWASFLYFIYVDPNEVASEWNEIKAVLSVNGDMWFITRDYINSTNSARVFTLKGGGQLIGYGGAGISGLSRNILGVLPGSERELKIPSLNIFNSDIYVFWKEQSSITSSIYTLRVLVPITQ